MVTKEELVTQQAKARQPVEDSPVEDDGEETPNEEGSVINEDKTED